MSDEDIDTPEKGAQVFASEHWLVSFGIVAGVLAVLALATGLLVSSRLSHTSATLDDVGKVTGATINSSEPVTFPYAAPRKDMLQTELDDVIFVTLDPELKHLTLTTFGAKGSTEEYDVRASGLQDKSVSLIAQKGEQKLSLMFSGTEIEAFGYNSATQRQAVVPFHRAYMMASHVAEAILNAESTPADQVPETIQKDGEDPSVIQEEPELPAEE